VSTINAEHYTYRVRWSPEDEAYIGTVAEMPSLSWAENSAKGAFAGIHALAKEVLLDMAGSSETPPEAIADRHYSGKFMVRVTPESHRNLVIDAAEQNVSLNRLAAGRLLR
jgi:predicted HicB family RNase H-like nuclease